MEQRWQVIQGGQDYRPPSLMRSVLAQRSTSYEQILAGHMLCSPELIPVYRKALSPEDFLDVYVAQLYRVLLEYVRLYGVEEIGKEHFCAALESLREQGADVDRLQREHFWPRVQLMRGMGAKVGPENPAYTEVMKAVLMRRMAQTGYRVDHLANRADFRALSASELSRLIYIDLDKRLDVASPRAKEDLGADMTARTEEFFRSPERGYQTPFAFINEHCHGLFRNDLTLIGGLSNTGKGRLLMAILTWLVVKEGQTVCLMSNEMTADEFFKCLVCTIVNTQAFHGHDLRLSQSDIVLNRFQDEEGKCIELLEGEEGEAFRLRVAQLSPQYRTFQEITQWWDERFRGRFRFVQVADDYSPQRLKQEIRRAKEQGCTVIAYDTLKAHQSSDWEDLVQAATELSEMIKADPDGLTGLATFQLTEEALDVRPEQLSQRHIARAKGIYHLADNMLMFQPLKKSLYGEYAVHNGGVGAPISREKEIMAFRIVKNRRGQGKDVTWGVQVNMDRNLWIGVGELRPWRRA